MNPINTKTDCFILTLNSPEGFLTVHPTQSPLSLTFNGPNAEVDGTLLKGKDFCFQQSLGRRSLANGGTEEIFSYSHISNPAVTLSVSLRTFPDSPFFRIRYALGGTGARLTKSGQKDQFSYTGFTLENPKRITEIQLSQFEQNAHAFLPHFEQRDEVFRTPQFSFMGPIALADWGGHTLLAAYEHGSEYPDTYLNFSTAFDGSRLEMNLQCVDGTYYNGEYFDDDTPYITPWFHCGICPGGEEELLRQYRSFLLLYLAENRESRKPYIFYNTWNNQERNRAFRNKRYLEDVNLEQMLKEIDIAHRMGMDVFVIDTAWYLATGNWEVDLKRYPDGLKTIKQKLDGYGMKFGLWFNPTAASVSSQINQLHHEYCKNENGTDEFMGQVWETEDSYCMCLVSGYADWFIQKLIATSKALGVTYFKWDAVSMYGCNSPNHRHGDEANSPEEREKCFGFKSGLALTRIVEEVSREIPDAIFDFDITEGGRYVGLGFLSAGKFFHMNNGPYYMDFDIPDAREIYEKNVNVFFHPGVSRDKVCRQFTKYDRIIPSILFLTHFLPDKPLYSQKSTLASLVLGGNGIWGDLHSLDEQDIKLFGDTLALYKKVADDVTAAYPVTKGFIGSSPEIHEKLNCNNSAGIVVFFTKSPTQVTHVTQKIDPSKLQTVVGADSWSVSGDGYLTIQVSLEANDSRIVFVFNQDTKL